MDVEDRKDRENILRECREMLNTAEAEKRDLTPVENEEYERKMRMAEQLKEGTLPIHQRMDPNDDGSGYQTRQTDEGEVRLLAPDERMSDFVPRETPGGVHADELDLGRMVKGMVSGDWAGSPAERRALAEGLGTSGGYTVPDAMAAQIIDNARAKSVCFQAGARTIPMDTSTLSVAVTTGDPTPQWLGENASATASDWTFGRRTLNAKTQYLLIKCSKELWDDTDILGGYVQDAVGTVMGNEPDRVILRGGKNGDGVEPRGIASWDFESGASIVTTTLGSGDGTTVYNYDLLFDWVYDLQVSNSVDADRMAIAMHPRTQYRFNVLKDGEGQYLDIPKRLNGLKWLNTTAIPITETVGVSTDCSEIYVGDFSQVWVGMRNSLVFNVSEEAGDAYRDNQVWIRAAMRADVTLAHPEHLHYITGVR